MIYTKEWLEDNPTTTRLKKKNLNGEKKEKNLSQLFAWVNKSTSLKKIPTQKMMS